MNIAMALPMSLVPGRGCNILSNGYGKATIFTFLDALKRRNKTLLDLDISNNQFGDQGGEKLADFIINDTVIKYVRCDSNNISINGWNAIYLSLHYNKTLQHISWPTVDIETALQQLSKPRKDDLIQLMMLIQSRLQRSVNPPKSGWTFTQNVLYKDVPPTPGEIEPAEDIRCQEKKSEENQKGGIETETFSENLTKEVQDELDEPTDVMFTTMSPNVAEEDLSGVHRRQ